MVRFLHELTPFEQLSLIDMSYSRINTYQLCHAKYFFGYILKEEQIFSAPAALGNIIHNVLEDHVGHEPLDLERMAELFALHRPTFDPDQAIDPALVEAGHTMMGEFADRHVDEEFDILAREQAFELVIGSALVRGFIDRIDREPDGLRVIDYKSGAYEERDIPNNLQLAIYVLAVAHMFPTVDIFHAELYYLRSGRRKHHTFLRTDLEGVEERILAAFHEIQTDIYFHETKNSRICGFCEHATTGICRTGVYRRAKRR